MSKKRVDEARWMQAAAALDGHYICPECGSEMIFDDPPWNNFLRCENCGYDTDVDSYGFDGETYSELYDTAPDEEIDEDGAEKYNDEYDGFRGFN